MRHVGECNNGDSARSRSRQLKAHSPKSYVACGSLCLDPGAHRVNFSAGLDNGDNDHGWLVIPTRPLASPDGVS